MMNSKTVEKATEKWEKDLSRGIKAEEAGQLLCLRSSYYLTHACSSHIQFNVSPPACHFKHPFKQGALLFIQQLFNSLYYECSISPSIVQLHVKQLENCRPETCEAQAKGQENGGASVLFVHGEHCRHVD